jgi:SanA protein
MFKWIYRICLIGGIGLVFCLGVNWYVGEFSENYVFEDFSQVPVTEVALVLGTGPKVADGRDNLFFLYRIQAANDLYQNKKVEKLLLSGDNSREDYNEPQAMKEALLELGVLEEDIVLDFAGFRTLDSVVRAKEIFGLDEMIVVSQEFHNERALFLARNMGIEAYAYNAESPNFGVAPRVYMREILARVYMVWDVYINETDPKFLGEELEI